MIKVHDIHLRFKAPVLRGVSLEVPHECIYALIGPGAAGKSVLFKTIAGLERVDVIYRRLNDAHIDPVVFSTDREAAGVPGLQ